VLGVTLLGCPWFKKKGEGNGTAASASATASIVAAPASSPSTLVSEPAGSGSAADPGIVEDESPDAAAAGSSDASSGDAPLSEGGANGDAMTDGDAKGDAKKDTGKAAPGIKKLDDEFPVKGKRKITVTNANVHRAPKDGVTMATIAKGTEVHLIAQYFDWYRVSYVDVLTGKKAQGWIYVTNFIGPRRKSCPAEWTYHFDKDGGWCERECTKKTDCKALKDYKCSAGSCYYDGE
jgi:hypothetical protein